MIKGDRKVAFLTYGRGIGSNSHKRATTVFRSACSGVRKG